MAKFIYIQKADLENDLAIIEGCLLGKTILGGDQLKILRSGSIVEVWPGFLKCGGSIDLVHKAALMRAGVWSYQPPLPCYTGDFLVDPSYYGKSVEGLFELQLVHKKELAVVDIPIPVKTMVDGRDAIGVLHIDAGFSTARLTLVLDPSIVIIPAIQMSLELTDSYFGNGPVFSGIFVTNH